MAMKISFQSALRVYTHPLTSMMTCDVCGGHHNLEISVPQQQL